MTREQLREAVEQLRRERDRALIAGSLHVCYGSDPVPETDGMPGQPHGAVTE